MADNDKIVTRYIGDREFRGSAFPILAREIFNAVRGAVGASTTETTAGNNADSPDVE